VSFGGAAAANNVELAEGRQFHQIVFGHGLERFAGFAPGGESADDYERVEAFFPQ
jgi:hypothetical protein